MKKTLLYLTLILIFEINIFSQSENDVHGVSFGFQDQWDFTTERNFPTVSLDTFTIIPCRKIDTMVFNNLPGFFASRFKNCIDPLLIDINQLTHKDKNHLIQLACDTKDPKYFDLIVKLIFADSIQKDTSTRRDFVRCLAAFKTDSSKNILLQLLNDKDKSLSAVSALALYQLGYYDISIKYFEENYHNESSKYTPIIYRALMIMGSVQSAQVLRRLVKTQSFIFYKLDGLAALSLMGYCDEAYKGFKLYTNILYDASIRRDAMSCLAYYIGTKEAFDIISKYQNDKVNFIKDQAKKEIKNYNFQINK